MTAPSSQLVRVQGMAAPPAQEALAPPAPAMVKQLARERLPIPAAPVTLVRLAPLRAPLRASVQKTEIRRKREERAEVATEAV